MAKKPKENPDLRYIKQLDSDPKGLREIYEHYRETCTENGGSATWSRATSALILELMDRLEKVEDMVKPVFHVGDKVELTEEVVRFVSRVWNVEKQGVISAVWTPEEKDYEYEVTFSNPTDGSWTLDFNASELRKVEHTGV